MSYKGQLSQTGPAFQTSSGTPTTKRDSSTTLGMKSVDNIKTVKLHSKRSRPIFLVPVSTRLQHAKTSFNSAVSFASAGRPHPMAILLCFAITFFVEPSLSLYLGHIVPWYNTPNFARSAITKPYPRSMIVDTQLSRLLIARKQAINIAKDIDSEIEALLQDKVYRRTFDAQDVDSNGLPFFNPRPSNSLSAVIGAQGGSWFPGPSGAGVEGSRMLEGRASRLSDRRTQDAQRPVRREPGPVLSMLQRAAALRERYTQMARQSQTKEITTRTFTPTTSQSTPDPSDEIESK